MKTVTVFGGEEKEIKRQDLVYFIINSDLIIIIICADINSAWQQQIP